MLLVGPSRIGSEWMIGAQVTTVVDAHIVARAVGVEVALAPVTSISTRMFHMRTLSQPHVIANPEQEDGLQPEHAIRIGLGFGVVHSSEAIRLAPQ